MTARFTELFSKTTTKYLSSPLEFTQNRPPATRLFLHDESTTKTIRQAMPAMDSDNLFIRKNRIFARKPFKPMKTYFILFPGDRFRKRQLPLFETKRTIHETDSVDSHDIGICSRLLLFESGFEKYSGRYCICYLVGSRNNPHIAYRPLCLQTASRLPGNPRADSNCRRSRDNQCFFQFRIPLNPVPAGQARSVTARRIFNDATGA